MGTELDPDWAMVDGEYEMTSPVASRKATDARHAQFVATREERDRASNPAAKVQKRWHYRYVAADLAWRAAALMPDQSDATAKLLCTAGGWIKGNDPAAANRFYRALVQRCDQTELGRQAKQLKWFPRNVPE